MKPTRIPCLGKALLLLPLAISANAAIYLESFPNFGPTQGAGNIAHSDAAIGWNARAGATATIPAINIFPVSQLAGAVTGFGYGAKASGNGIGLAYTSEIAAFNVDLTDIPAITFWTRNANTTDIFRVVVGIDVSGTTNWFASDQTFSSTVADSTWEQETFNVTTTGSAWRALTFNPTVELSLAATTLGSDLPSGQLVTTGLFMTSAAGAANSGTVRYDQFTVVPEPSSLLLGAGGLGLLCLRRKR